MSQDSKAKKRVNIVDEHDENMKQMRQSLMSSEDVDAKKESVNKMAKNSQRISLLGGDQEPMFLGFIKQVQSENNEDGRPTDSLYKSRCNISLISNYILYFVFIANTVFFLYFAVRNFEQQECYANYLSTSSANANNGKDITRRFRAIFIIGSICGLLELLRNTANLSAKCLKYMRLAIIFQYLGFITAFLFMLNFILMQLYRFTHLGRVCSGDFLDDRGTVGVFELASRFPEYLIIQGYFIKVMIIVYYSMFGIIFVTIILVACTVKYQQN